MTVIGVDVDGVVADLYKPWLERYNRDYNDCLTVDKLTEWGMDKLVKPECGTKIFSYLSQPDLYQDVPVIQDAQYAIEKLEEVYQVVFVTSNLRGMTDQKWEWLIRHGFLPDTNYTDKMIIATNKSLIKMDILIDDAYHNITHFGGTGILFGNYPHSRNKPGLHAVAHDWHEVLRLLV